jgi:hypothetical protein
MSNPFETVNIITLPSLYTTYALSADGENLWLTESFTNNLYKIPYSNSNMYSILKITSMETAYGGPSSNGTYVGMVGNSFGYFKLCIMKCSDPINTQKLVSLPHLCNTINIDKNYIWSSSAYSSQNPTLSEIYQFSLDGILLSTIPMPPSSSILALSSDGTNLWAATNGTDTIPLHSITKISCNDVSNISTVDLGIINEGPITIFSDGENVWVGVIGYNELLLKNVIKISCSTLNTTQITMPSSPLSVCSNGTFCFVACAGNEITINDGVYLIDCTTSNILQPQLTPNAPSPISLVAINGKYGWASDRGLNGPTKIYQYIQMANTNSLVNPYNVNFVAPGRESNGSWSQTLTESTTFGNPLQQNWSSIAISGDGQFVLACVSGGKVYSSSNYGYNLQPDNSLPVKTWKSVTISPDGTKAAVCAQGDYVYIASLSGTNWVWEQIGPQTSWWSVTFSGDSLSIAACVNSKTVSSNNGIFTGSYNGTTWSFSQSAANYQDWVSITNINNTKNFAACINDINNILNVYKGIYSSSSLNWTWSTVNCPPNINFISITSNSDGSNVFACSNSYIYIATSNLDYLDTWTQTSAPNANWSSIACDSTGQYILACVNGGGVYSSWDYGATWQLQDTNGLPSTATWSAVAMGSTCSQVAGCVNNGYVYISPTFQGFVWQSCYALNVQWVDIECDSTGQNLIAVNNNPNGNVYLSKDYGITWQITNVLGGDPIPTANWNYVATNNDGSILGAVIFEGNAYISTNGGINWIKPTLETGTNTTQCNQISFNSVGTYGVICSYTTTTEGGDVEDGRLYISKNLSNVNSWAITSPNPPPDSTNKWTAVKFSGDGSTIYAACFKYNPSNQSSIFLGTYNSVNNTCSWIKVFNNITLDISPPKFINIACSADGVYVATVNATESSSEGSLPTNIWLSSDSGTNWKNLDDTTNPPIFYPSLPSEDQANYGFQRVTMTPDGSKLAIVFYGHTVYSGYVYVSYNNGATWIKQIEGLPAQANAWVAITTNNDMSKLFICAYESASGYGGSTGIFNGSPSTTSWTPQLNALPTVNSFSRVAISSNGQYLAVVADNYDNKFKNLGIWISSNYGVNWKQSNAAYLDWNALGMDNTGQYLVAGVYGGQIYTSSNYGLDWTVQTSGLPATANWISISFSNNSDPSSTSQYVYAQPSIDDPYYSTDRGITWFLSNGAAYWGNGMASSSDGKYAYYGAVPGGAQGIYATINYGADSQFKLINATSGNWNYIATDSTGQYVVVVNTDNNADYTIGNYGIWLSTNCGSNIVEGTTQTVTWTQIAVQNLLWQSISLVKVGTNLLITAICFNGLIYVCNYNTLDNTYSWTLNSATTSGGIFPATYLIDIKSSSNGTKLVMCSLNGGVWLSSDSGASWSQSTLSYNSFKPGLTSSSTGQNLAAIVNYNKPYISNDYGSNWTQLTNSEIPSSVNWYSIASSITGQYIVLSTSDGTIYISNNYAQSWSITNIFSNPIVSISSSGQYVVAACKLGSIYISSDYGSIWTQLTTTNGLPSTSEDWSSIKISGSGQYVAGTINGGQIYISSDFGLNWSPINLLTGAWSSVAISNSGQYIVATINGGAIYGSSDFGSTINIINSTVKNWSSITISGTGQNIVASVTGESIYRSTDFGTTWSVINSTSADWNAIVGSNSGQYLAVLNTDNTNSNTNISIYSSYMDIGNIYGSLINQLQLQIQSLNPSLNSNPPGSVISYSGTSDPNGWVVMDGQPRPNEGQFNNVLSLGIGTSSNNNSVYTPPNYNGAYITGNINLGNPINLKWILKL